MLQEVERSLPATKPMDVLNLSTLVLNADYQPLSTWPLSVISAQQAVIDYCKKTVQIVDTWKDAFGNELLVRSSSITVPVPKVIVLVQYASIDTKAKFTRKSVILRDRFTCQYCGNRFPMDKLTFDHVHPRSLGGKTVWTNIVAACDPCNLRKGDKLPKGPRGLYRPLKDPVQPSNAELLKLGLEFLSENMKEDFGSWLYWNVELDP